MSYTPSLISDISRWQEEAFKNRKLRIHPVPKENELISSWIVRLAISNELNPYSFMSVHMKEFYYLLRQDMDATTKTEFFERLSFKTGLPVERIRNLSLASYDGSIFIADEKTTRRPFILYINNRGASNRLFAYRYCPFCLQEEEYLKKEWRLMFSTVCLKHNVFLLDRCPHCNKHLFPFVWGDRKTLNFHCPYCHNKYKDNVDFAIPVPKDSKVSHYQEKIYEIIENRYFTFEGERYFSVLLFPAIAQVIKMILTWNKRNYDLFKREKELLNINKLPVIKTQAILSLDLKQHAILFTVAMDILNNKENFDKFFKDNKMKPFQLRKDMSFIPYWYKVLTDEYFHIKYISTEEIKNAIEYLIKKGKKPKKITLQKLFGAFFDKRKRKDIYELMEKYKKAYRTK